MLTLHRLKPDHYVVVSDEIIKEGDYYINTEPEQGSPKSSTIYEGQPVTLENGYAGRGYKDREYFKKWMRKITYSTQPIEFEYVMVEDRSWQEPYFDRVKELNLSYVEALVEDTSLREKADLFYRHQPPPTEIRGMLLSAQKKGFCDGYNQCLEDNKDKRFSEEDLRKVFNMARKHIELGINKVSRAYSYTEDEAISSLTQHKDTWEVEFIDGQLKLK